MEQHINVETRELPMHSQQPLEQLAVNCYVYILQHIQKVVKQLTANIYIFFRGTKQMGKNKVKVTGFRIEDETILDKLNIIAKNNCRTRNKEVEYALKQYVQKYESQNGAINIKNNITIGDNNNGNININQGDNNNGANNTTINNK